MTDATGGTWVEHDFRLVAGGVLAKAELAYLTVGRLAPARDNVVLMTHGYTSSHHYIEPDSLAAEGSWSALVGPGRAFDTDRFFIISCNALGSCHGSTGPASIDPRTGQAYGEDFPLATFEDTVRLQRALLASLGVQRLHAVAGPSMGGFHALQWAIQCPELVDRVVVAVSGLGDPAAHAAARDALAAGLRALPGWNGGRPQPEATIPFLTQLRVQTLRDYGMGTWLADQGWSAEARELQLHDLARDWASGFHPWSLVALRDAIARFDARPGLRAIRAPVLLALSTTDAQFPASGLPGVLEELRAAGVAASGCVIDSRYGHLASGLDWQLWEAALRRFLG